jgi:uncharacterized membrane protein (DUF2068 family)
MALVWAVPPVAFALGAVLALVQLRGIAEAAGDLQVELLRFSEVQVAVAEVRTATADARATARGMRRA